MQPYSIVILAAGMGTRLGRPFPKPLTRLATGESLIARQLGGLAGLTGEEHPAYIVVGYKKELIMEEFPNAVFVYNPDYSETNTAKSLLRALVAAPPGGVLWMNGDVVFEPGLLDELAPHLDRGENLICVNHARVGEEEVKYSVDADGWVRSLSKTVEDALGEAVGINFVNATDKLVLVRHLEQVSDTDYFERAIETAIEAGELRMRPVDISAYSCIEVDFDEDLDRANELFAD
jgi:CDP-glycerol glycerophosphotransferase